MAPQPVQASRLPSHFGQLTYAVEDFSHGHGFVPSETLNLHLEQRWYDTVGKRKTTTPPCTFHLDPGPSFATKAMAFSKLVPAGMDTAFTGGREHPWFEPAPPLKDQLP